MNQPNLRILIVDDNVAIHNDFIKILITEHKEEKNHLSALENEIFGIEEKKAPTFLPAFEIDTASQGEEGFQKVVTALKENRPYAMAFVDVRMPPGWDGIETIKHIWEVDKNIQIVICTAYSDYSWEDTISELGQSDSLLILKKPFDVVAVRQLACALTKKWALMQETTQHFTFLESKIKERTFSLEKALITTQESQKELEYQAYHDELTGLLNRSAIMEKIEIAMTESSFIAVLFIDFDRFKIINDSLGHSAGDELLKSYAARLKLFEDKNHIAARLGGDEFIMLVKYPYKQAELVDLAHRILNMTKNPFEIAGKSVTVTTSMGISVSSEKTKSVDELLQCADDAMYYAKELGADRVQFYSEDLNQKALVRLELETSLREAVAKGEFFLSYQPEVDLLSEKLVAVEALIRWNHPTRGLLGPNEFILVAEESSIIISIGEWILRTACAQNKAWQNKGLTPVKMSVNVTTQQFKQPDFALTVAQILKDTDLDPHYLIIEVKENTLIDNPVIVATINDLKKIGVSIVLDDFGTGYSSLTYLRKIPLDGIKIDKSFIDNISGNKEDEVIIEAIITMAHSLNLWVLAEGVESKEQLNFLQLHKCNAVQGYYYSRPTAPDELHLMMS